VNGLAFVHFDESDVVRHHLVQRIIRAYDEFKTRLAGPQLSLLESKASVAEVKPASNGKNGQSENGASPLPNSPLDEPRVQD
jgi:phosphate starvation-inducible PhoH-like protein